MSPNRKICFIKLLSIGFAASVSAAAALDQFTTVHFPTGRETGDIIVTDPGSSYTERHSPGKLFAVASGIKRLPKNVDLGYICKDQTEQNDPIDVVEFFPKSQLTFVVLKNAVFENKSLDKLLKFKKMRRLELTRTDVDDQTVAKVADLPLETLVVDRTKVHGPFLVALARNPGIVHLGIDHNSLDLNYLQELENFPRLRVLNIACIDLKDSNLLPVSRLQNLECLDISQNQALTSTSLTYLKKLRKLKDLNIEDTSITALDLLQLKGLPLKFIHMDEKQKSVGYSSLLKTFPQAKVLVEHTEQKKYGIFGNLEN